MKNRISCLALLLFMFVAAKANPVSETQAREVGFKFLNATQKTNMKDIEALRLVKTYRCTTGEAAFYVFNTSTGYAIVSADDCVTPILGYSYEGPFDVDNIPIQMQDYLNGFMKQIEYGVTHHLVADDNTAAQWERVRTTGRITDGRDAHEVLPLLRVRWNQNCGYNAHCPADDEAVYTCGHVWAGCVATAMAQIMHYWRYPERGQGSHSYVPSTHPEYGELFVDFSSTTYDWANMPDILSGAASETEIDAVATLIYHCGVSVDMMYGATASGAYSDKVPSALLNYFKYSNDLEGMYKGNNNADWMAKVKASLDARCPVYYSGDDNTTGHAFVCDGYDRNDLFHMNWGWEGSSNGYFALDALVMPNHDFSMHNYAVFNIHRPYDPSHTYEINVSINSSMVGTVTGSGTFRMGDVCTLTAQPSENCAFRAWLENGRILSLDPEYSFVVVEDQNIEAFFDGEWSAQVEAACVEDTLLFTNSAVISWTNGPSGDGDMHSEWPLLAWFSCDASHAGVATDGQYIYTGTWADNQDSLFYKWDLAGNIVESFNVEGCGKVYDLTYDGRYYYGSQSGSDLYCIDFANKTLVDVIHPSYSGFNCCAYDPDYDGFWVDYGYSLKLMDRNGQFIKDGPATDSYVSAAYYKNALGEPHLLLMDRDSKVYDYDINADVLGQEVLCQIYDGPYSAHAFGSFVGEYMGKTAFFGVLNYRCVAIYEIPVELSQVQLHRVYRVEGEVDGNVAPSDPELIAYRLFGSSFTDRAFDTLSSGIYTYGVSLLTDGMESQIRWSNPIEHKRQFFISASAHNEEGGTVTGEGRYDEGAVCTLTATANPNYIFTEWLKNGNVVSTAPEYSFEVTEDADYVARFEWNMAEIVALVTPHESGTVTGQGSYEKGSECTLTATPAPKYSFLEWQKDGVVVSTEAVYSFTVTEDAEYEARFEQTAFEIQVFVAPQGSGEVTGAGIYNNGETVTLVVTPKNNYRFSQWTENGVFLSSETTYSFVATNDRTIYANLVYNHGVDEHGQELLSLHPNPVDDHLVVECTQPVRRCEIFSVSGALVYAIDEVDGPSVEIGVDKLSPGLYMIRIITDGYSLTEKFVKQ